MQYSIRLAFVVLLLFAGVTIGVPRADRLYDVVHTTGCTSDAAPALGMESGAIGDSQLHASSSFDAHSVGQQNARIRTEKASGAWCPKQQISDDSSEFIQIDFLRPHVIHAVETQGRYGNGTGREFVEFYFVDYSLDGADDVNVTWTRYRSQNGDTLFTGNTDTVSAVKRRLDPPIIARIVRVVPYSARTQTACLRLELYGCRYDVAATVSTVTKNVESIDEVVVYMASFQTQHYLLLAGAILTVVGLFVCLTVVIYRSADSSKCKYLRKSKSRDQLAQKLRADGTKSARDAFAPFFGTQPPLPPSLPRANLVATLGNVKAGGLPKNLLLDTTFRPSQPTWTDDEEIDGVNCYATVQPHRTAKPSITSASVTMPNSGTLSSCCSISADGSCSSTSAVSTQRRSGGAPPSLRDFHFPPPPPPATAQRAVHAIRHHRESATDTMEENIYAKPVTVVRGMRPSATFAPQKSHSARAHRWPLLRPPRVSTTLDQIRGAIDFSDGTLSLPKRLAKTVSPESGIGSDSRNCVSQCSSHSPEAYETEQPMLRAVPRSSLCVGERLGGGKFTDVCAVTLTDGSARRLALKSIQSGLDSSSLSAARQALEAESRVLSTIHHPYIITYAGTCNDGAILTEYAEWGDLYAALATGRLRLAGDRRAFLSICSQIADALAHLESRQIVHGHFSTRSCLLIASTDVPRVRVAAPRGTNLHAQLRFSAPEAIILNEWSNKTDVWSFGAAAWELAHETRRQPFDALTNARLHDNARRIIERSADAILLDFDTLPVETVSKFVREELTRCGRPAPANRPDFCQLSAFFHLTLNGP